MAKIIKVGSQNPTFTSQKIKKASPIHTHRNSNEATNPFKFTNFEGKTLPFEFADVFEGIKPHSANKLRMIASSVAGSMSKIRSSVPESIINFVRRVQGGITGAINYAKNIAEIPAIKQTREFLLAERHLPSMEGITSHISGIKENISSKMEFLNRDVVDIGKDIKTAWTGMVSNISFAGRSKYATMTVAELETHFAAALAEGGSNE